MEYQPLFGTKFRDLIESFGIEVPRIEHIEVNGSKVKIKVNGSDSDIEAILEALKDPISDIELQALKSDGLEINFQNEDGCSPLSNDIITTDNGLFYKGRRVVLHIAQAYYENTKFTPPENLHKYHLHYCSELKKQKAKGNLEKYRVSLSEDGKFHYVFKEENGGVVKNQKLNICKTCLRDFYKKESYKKIGITYAKGENRNFLDVSGFKLKHFFDNQPETVQSGDSPKFLFDGLNLDGMDMDYNEVSAEYRKDWREISIARKKAEKYTCQECGWKPIQNRDKKFIHTHHLDKNKSNNLSSNLKVLCMECHYNYHPTLKEKQVYKGFITLKEQLKNAKLGTVTAISLDEKLGKFVKIDEVTARVPKDSEFFNQITLGNKVRYSIKVLKDGKKGADILEIV